MVKKRVSPEVELLLITLLLAGGKIKGKTKLQKLAYIVWKKLYDTSLEKKLPRDIARLLSIKPKPGPYGGVILELQDKAPREASAKNLIYWLKPVNASETFELTSEGREIALALKKKLDTLGIDINGELQALAELPINEVLKIVYEKSLPEHLSRSRIREAMKMPGSVIVGEPSEETISLIDDLEKEGSIKTDKKYMRIGECDELEPGLVLCVRKDKKNRPYFVININNKLFEVNH